MRRLLHRAWAYLAGYFWIACPVCGTEFGGHQWEGASIPVRGRPSVGTAVCSPECAHPAPTEGP